VVDAAGMVGRLSCDQEPLQSPLRDRTRLETNGGGGIVTLTVLIHGKAPETALVTPLQRWQRSIPPSPRAGRGGELAG
jgi:hypothetical protein